MALPEKSVLLIVKDFSPDKSGFEMTDRKINYDRNKKSS